MEVGNGCAGDQGSVVEGACREGHQDGRICWRGEIHMSFLRSGSRESQYLPISEKVSIGTTYLVKYMLLILVK
jgi:hypothetical protein